MEETSEEYGDLAPQLGLIAARIARRLNRPGFGELTSTQLSALASIDGRGPIRLGDLALVEGIAAPTITRLVDKLHERNLVTRQRDPVDARSAYISITDEGHALLEDAERTGTLSLCTRLQALEPHERSAILNALPALEKLAKIEASESVSEAIRFPPRRPRPF
jgi:DNA-binding MarR family transcriptional regulator